MKITIPKLITYEAQYLEVYAKFRYIGTGEDDDIHPSLPGLVNDTWVATIDISYKCIRNWKANKEWKIFGKVCDAGEYFLRDADWNVIEHLPYGSYVPRAINNGNSDYIDITVSPDGIITKGWDRDLSDFIEEARGRIEL